MKMPSELRLAYISPLNPIPSGISDYSEALLPALAEYFHITIYSDCDIPSNHQIVERFQIYPVPELLRHHLGYDLRLYQLGNSPHHRNAFTILRLLPGVVVLHEPFLHHGLYHSSQIQYIREAFYEIGRPDWDILGCLVRDLREDNRQRLLKSPLVRRIVDTSLGILVHSHTAYQIVKRYAINPGRLHPAIPKLKVISQPLVLPDVDKISEYRVKLGLPQEAAIFGMAGFIHPIKEPYLALQAFAKLQVDLPNTLFLFIGEVLQETGDLRTLAKELGISDRVIFLGRVEPLERLHQAMAACDVILNLRRATIGETSAVALWAMALGKPIIVRNIGWFSELPDDACVKIGPEDGVEKLAAVMRALATSPEMRFRIGQKARDYVQRECDPSRVAREYAEFLWDVYLSVAHP